MKRKNCCCRVPLCHGQSKENLVDGYYFLKEKNGEILFGLFQDIQEEKGRDLVVAKYCLLCGRKLNK